METSSALPVRRGGSYFIVYQTFDLEVDCTEPEPAMYTNELGDQGTI